jgi:hypothetical protein
MEKPLKISENGKSNTEAHTLMAFNNSTVRFKNKETRWCEKTTQDCGNHIFLTITQLLFGSDEYQQPLLNPCPAAKYAPKSCILPVSVSKCPSKLNHRPGMRN